MISLLTRRLRKRTQSAMFSTSKLNLDSIYAVSSGSGKCGVAVIRLSGPETKHAVCKLMRVELPPKARYAVLCNIYNQENLMLDKALILWFPKPYSFTGEDVCELQVHGGTAVISSVFKAISEIKGFRPAEPGDYTKRAFFNGKLDLTEVEGLGDLIHSETEAQRRQALRQMEGGLSRTYNDWRRRLLTSLSHLEAYIDFSEDQEIGDSVITSVSNNVDELIKNIYDHLNDKRRGERLRQGVSMTIIGAPNVGKSTLLNELTQRPTAIVSNIPGTTRDIVESMLDIGGYPVVVSDTAGIRDTLNPIEQEGVQRAKNKAKLSDLLLLMYEVKELTLDKIESDLEMLCTSIEYDNVVIVVNKIDLIKRNEQMTIEKVLNNSKYKVCFISCNEGEGITELLSIISLKLKHLCEGNYAALSPSITQERHRFHVKKCYEHLQECAEHLNFDIVISAQYLRLAMNELGKVTGKIGAEDILDIIFKDFCIGK